MSIPLKLLESDTTLVHVHFQKTLKARRRDIKFLKYVNGILCVLIITAAVYLLLNVFLGGPRLDRLPEYAAVDKKTDRELSSDANAKWNELQRSMERRNIFEPLDLVSPSQKVAFEQEILQRIRIVGVMLDEAPKAIIEIIASGETAFVSKGDAVAGAVVTDILENKVILTYNDTKLELLR